MTTKKSEHGAAAEGNAEVQAKADEMLAKGYDGETFDPNPNIAYSILSGPDSPPLVEDNKSRAVVDTQKEAKKDA